MKQHIQLLTQYDSFIEENPKANLEDFYVFMNNKIQETVGESRKMAGNYNYLMRCIARITSIYQLYLRSALKDAEMEVPEGFTFLATLHFNGDMRKSELINFNLIEISTGSEILNRLKKHKLIIDKEDISDKRAKLVSITDKGQKRLLPFITTTQKLRSIIFQNISEDEVKSCLSILEPIEAKYSKIVVNDRTEIIERLKA
jgi:DNA-binding MarR family transcriptional regulator